MLLYHYSTRVFWYVLYDHISFMLRSCLLCKPLFLSVVDVVLPADGSTTTRVQGLGFSVTLAAFMLAGLRQYRQWSRSCAGSAGGL